MEPIEKEEKKTQREQTATSESDAWKGEWNERTEYLIGERGVAALKEACVVVVGVGGVGAYAAEMVARAGVGALFLVDGDVLTVTNLNRHLLGARADVGTAKVDLMARRVRAFNPACAVTARAEFVREDTPRAFFPARVDALIDACDIASVKAHLAALCLAHGIPAVVATGAARRLDPTRVRLALLSETEGDPLAALLRRRVRRLCGDAALDRLTVVVSDEPPSPVPAACKDGRGRATLPSFCTTPAAAGCAAAHFAITRILAAAGVVPDTLPAPKTRSARAKLEKAKKKRINAHTQQIHQQSEGQKRPRDAPQSSADPAGTTATATTTEEMTTD